MAHARVCMNADEIITESEIQRQIIAELRQRGAFVLRNNSSRGGRQRRSFNEPGTPDLFVVEPGRAYWVEVKTPTGQISRDQERVHEWLERMGQEVIIARSVEDVQEV